MQVEFDDGTLLLRNAPDDVPYGGGTTASTSTEREHIDIEPCSSGAG